MEIRLPLTMQPAKLTPEQTALLASLQKALADAGLDHTIIQPKTGVWQWIFKSGVLNGWKTYLNVIAALLYLGYCWYRRMVPDWTVMTMFGFSTIASLRSAIKTAVAQIINALVNPQSPAAVVTAAEVPPPSVEQVQAAVKQVEQPLPQV